jgi:uncharacterized membrane protein YqiK
MDVLAQVQGIVMEHAFTIGIALLITLVVAGIAWFSMSRSSGSGSKGEVLVNQARVNGSTTDVSNPDQESQEQQADSGPTVPYGTPQEAAMDNE